MTAAAEPLFHETAPERAPLELVSTTSETTDEHEAMQRVAERSFARDVVKGALVGIVICAGLWTLLVLVALAGTGAELGAALWMGAAVGVFAGIFFGGWIGTLVGARHLDDLE
jgi:hypothetical protein